MAATYRTRYTIQQQQQHRWPFNCSILIQGKEARPINITPDTQLTITNAVELTVGNHKFKARSAAVATEWITVLRGSGNGAQGRKILGTVTAQEKQVELTRLFGLFDLDESGYIEVQELDALGQSRRCSPPPPCMNYLRVLQGEAGVIGQLRLTEQELGHRVNQREPESQPEQECQ